jgi:peptidoglycan/LPS O-acetylase OafA/YrhL
MSALNTSEVNVAPIEDKAHGLRLTQVDGLRAIAALSVVAFHYTTRFNQLFLHTSPTHVEVPFGYLGVNLFFAISGFVIYMTLDRSQVPLDFVVSRFSRLFPSYWAAVILTWIVVSAVGLQAYEVSWKAAAFNLTMLQAFFSVPDVDGVYWSLQIELLFYIWMLVLWVTGALRFAAYVCIGWLVLAIVAGFSERIIGIRLPYSLSYFLLLDWIPWFAMGMTTFLTLKEKSFKAIHVVVLLFALIAIASKNQMPTLVFAPVVFIILFAASRSRVPLLAWKPLVFFGVISYPLYLVHEKIGWLVILKGETLFASPWTSIGIAFICSVTLAVVLHKAVEGPGSQAIRRFYKAHAGRINANEFNPKRWAIGGLISILVFATGYMVTSRMKKANETPQFNLVVNQPRSLDRGKCLFNDQHGSPHLLIVLGQSNAASFTEPTANPTTTPVFFDGSCSQERDPIPGTNGSGASVWTAMSSRLQTALPDHVFVIAPFAVGNTRVADWITQGPLRRQLEKFLVDARNSRLPITAVFWQQGEADSIEGTPALKYSNDLLELRKVLESAEITAPLVVAKSTYCNGKEYGPIRRAIDLAASTNPKISIGPDTDQLREEFRRDGCHFNSAGRKEAASLWANEVVLLSKIKAH